MTSAPLFPREGMSDDDVAKMQALVSHTFGAMRTTYEYDAAGRPIARAQQMGLLGEDRVTYRYDERGNPIEQRDVQVSREMNFEEDGTPRTSPDTTRIHDVRFAYAYDGHGNWTERTVSGRIREDAERALERRAADDRVPAGLKACATRSGYRGGSSSRAPAGRRRRSRQRFARDPRTSRACRCRSPA